MISSQVKKLATGLTVFLFTALLFGAPSLAQIARSQSRRLPVCQFPSVIGPYSSESCPHRHPVAMKQGTTLLANSPPVPVTSTEGKDGSKAQSAELFQAIDTGDASKVSQLLNGGVAVNVTNEKGMPPLVFLFSMSPYRGTPKERLEIARLLLSHGAAPNGLVPLSVNSSRVPVLVWAIQSTQSFEVVRLFLKYGADPTMEGSKSLFASVFLGRKRIVTLLIDAGAQVNARDDFGQTPLFLVNTLTVAKELVGRGANVNAIDNEGRSVVEYLSDPRKHCGKEGCMPVNEKIVNYLKSEGAK